MKSQIHASAVAVGELGVLILGGSGVGKSSLALDLIALGAVLIADDQVNLAEKEGKMHLYRPAGLPAAIEARGVGLLNAETVNSAELALVVDLGQSETDRLPPHRYWDGCPRKIPLVYGPYRPQLAGTIRQFIIAGRYD